MVGGLKSLGSYSFLRMAIDLILLAEHIMHNKSPKEYELQEDHCPKLQVSWEAVSRSLSKRTLISHIDTQHDMTTLYIVE